MIINNKALIDVRSKKYLVLIDYIRILACIQVFLYHLGLLKGGYLAVSIFFVLSGYLACYSAFKEEKFSILSYYRNKVLKIYLPLLLFVFITIFAVSFFQDVYWVNIRGETSSVLLGYNNYWQLQANLDYFTKQIDSPFMHLWYISILFQFYLIFPFIFIFLKKIGDKVKKIIPCILLALLTLGFSIYFYYNSLNGNMMNTYYDTFSRAFSIFAGLLVCFIHHYYKPFMYSFMKNKVWTKIIFFIYVSILILMSVFVDSSSSYFAISMLATTLITVRLLDYASIIKKDNYTLKDKIIKYLSSISYEIYLFQYPVIFLFQYIELNSFLKILCIVLITIFASITLKFALNIKKGNKVIWLRIILCIFIIIISSFGIKKFEDSKEIAIRIKELEEQLEKNEIMMEEKQKEYAEIIKEEQKKFASSLEEIDELLNNLDEKITTLPVVGIGDSVMLGALPNLYKQFSNGYFDAKISRTAWVVEKMLNNLKENDMLGNPIIIHLGTNGDCSESCKLDILNASENREIFWVNVTNDNNVFVNEKLNDFATKHENVHIIDWENISYGHRNYFYADGIHLTEDGKKAYTKAIYEAIYNFYLEEYTKKKNDIISSFEENKITFYSDDILINVADNISKKVDNTKFVFKDFFTYDNLKTMLEEGISNHSLGKKVVLAFGSTKLTEEEYTKLLDILVDKQVYILAKDKETLEKISNIENKNIVIIDLYNQIKDNPEYMLFDKIHLNDAGNKLLSDILIDTLNNKDE